MQTKTEKRGGVSSGWVGQLLRGYVYATAAFLAGAGLLLVFTACDAARLPQFRERDALFGLTTRTLLAVAGLLYLALSAYLFVGRDWMMRGLVILWAGLNHVVYYLGMVWLHAAAPFPAVVLVGWRIGVRPEVVDRRWKWFIASLVVGSTLLLLVEWRRLKQVEAAALLKRWRELREHGDKPR